MNLKKEISLILMVMIPFLYLAYIWGQLPEQVPMHWNYKGEVDRYGNKIELLLIPILLPLLTYFIFLIVPRIDPKDKIKQMGKKYDSLKFLLVAFMSGLALYIIYTAQHPSEFTSPNLYFVLGFLFIILGNYFKTLRPNYFVGIRTPWTLESESIWKETHNLGGKLWFGGGLVVVCGSLFLPHFPSLIVFFIVTGIILIVPIVYSYLLFKREKNSDLKIG